jgi:hypothetical protein
MSSGANAPMGTVMAVYVSPSIPRLIPNPMSIEGSQSPHVKINVKIKNKKGVLYCFWSSKIFSCDACLFEEALTLPQF